MRRQNYKTAISKQFSNENRFTRREQLPQSYPKGKKNEKKHRNGSTTTPLSSI